MSRRYALVCAPLAPSPRFVAVVRNTTRDPSADGRAKTAEASLDPAPFRPTRLSQVAVPGAAAWTGAAVHRPATTTTSAIIPRILRLPRSVDDRPYGLREAKTNGERRQGGQVVVRRGP